jgi:hypothetical protein
MSQIQKGIFGALAVALTLGAAQFAAGQDLIGRQMAGVAPEVGINRAAKADRAAAPSGTTQTRTIALRVDSLSDTSILIRVPEETRARPAPSFAKPGKTAVACEPMVSVLTEVAKMLQPGRCVT